MRSKLNAMRLDLADIGQTEHLETAAVGQDRQWPIDKSVQPARFTNDLKAGPNKEVVCITQNNLCCGFAQFSRIKRLDASLRAHGHENRRVNHATRRCDSPQPRPALLILLQQFEHCKNLKHVTGVEQSEIATNK